MRNPASIRTTSAEDALPGFWRLELGVEKFSPDVSSSFSPEIRVPKNWIPETPIPVPENRADWGTRTCSKAVRIFHKNPNPPQTKIRCPTQHQYKRVGWLFFRCEWHIALPWLQWPIAARRGLYHHHNYAAYDNDNHLDLHCVGRCEVTVVGTSIKTSGDDGACLLTTCDLH